MKWVPGAVVGSIVAGGNGRGNRNNQLNSPYGMFVEADTLTIWIADTYNHRIVKWPSPSTSVVVAGSYGSAVNQFMYPRDIFVDASASNTIYVADTGNHRIQKWLPGATSGITVAGRPSVAGNAIYQLNSPEAVIVDTSGNMYISDSGNSRIVRWPPGATSGMLIAANGGVGKEPTQLNIPLGLCFDSSGALVVADFRNHRVQKFAVSCRMYHT
ncbi:unnamed protein product [Rotaria sp. Silwood1]|nr:unnamed protein product [Rotaria sp. Silwood1]